MHFLQAVLVGAFLVAGANCCSRGFDNISGSCFAFHTEHLLSWTDANEFCKNQTVKGTLAKITKGTTLRATYEYIMDYGIKGSFWLGATDMECEDDWTWHDKDRVTRGTPFWAIHSNLIGGWSHEPSGGAKENCLSLDSERFYYFNDANCDNLHHPLCQEA